VAVIKRLNLSAAAFFFFTMAVSLTAPVDPAKAEDYASAQAYVHDFNNNITVYTGVFALNKDLSLDTSLYFKYTVDLINPAFGEGEGGGEHAVKGAAYTATPVAAVSSASSAAAAGRDTRNELTAGFTHNFGNIIGVEAYYDFSKEKDYMSNTPTITLKKDLFEKNTTLTLGYSINIDKINGQFMDRTEGRTTNNYFAGITQVITPQTIAQLGYARSVSRGFESEGIRLVPTDGTPVSQSTCAAISATCATESFPSSRSRNAYIFGINQYFADGPTPIFRRSSLRLTLRYYTDSWDIKSRTAELEYYKYLTDDLIMRLDYRYYNQSKAFFVKDVYTPSDVFRSSSPQLLKLSTNLGGIKFIYNFPVRKNDDFSLLQLNGIEGKYEYYTETIGVHAHILMAGLRLVF
jgi:uncharacterized protein DUF3570